MDTVQVLQGADGIKQAYEESLRVGQLDIVCLADNYHQVIGDYFDTMFAPRLYDHVKTREILPDTTGNRVSAKSKNAAINATRFLQTHASESDMLLSIDRVVLISFGAHPMAVRITDPEIVSSFHQQFDALWNSLS